MYKNLPEIAERWERETTSISSGLAIMANQKHLYTPATKKSKISINFAKYNNSSTTSQLIR
jgi:hypothetical protein